MKTDREMLERLVGAWSGGLLDEWSRVLGDARQHLERSAQETPEPPPQPWEPPATYHWLAAATGVTHAPMMSRDVHAFGLLYPTAAAADNAHVAMRRHHRKLVYVAEHAPRFRQPTPRQLEEEPYYFVFYDTAKKEWRSAKTADYYSTDEVYMPLETANRLVNDLTTGRVKL